MNPGRFHVRSESGQALLLVLGMVAVLLFGVLILTAIGQALGGKSAAQRAADLSAVSAARSMQRDYPRLFLPPVLPNGATNPRHMPLPVYLARARRTATSGARRNGAQVGLGDVNFPGASFAPTRVAVRIRESVRVNVDGLGSRRRRTVAVRARAVAELSAPADAVLGFPSRGSGGGYEGRLAYRMGKPMRPDVAEAFDRMAAAARRDGHALSITSAFRSDAEQARLFAAN